jgi:uncharacterized protein Yka (UPF0111/DUF47 family)
MRFLPKDQRFFEYFDQQIAMIREAAGLLKEILAGSGQNQHVARIAEIEKNADGVMHRLEEKLNKSFVTPVDPEDLQSLASALDEVLDLIEAAAFRIEVYQLPAIPESGRKLGALIEQCAETCAGVRRAKGERFREALGEHYKYPCGVERPRIGIGKHGPSGGSRTLCRRCHGTHGVPQRYQRHLRRSGRW